MVAFKLPECGDYICGECYLELNLITPLEAISKDVMRGLPFACQCDVCGYDFLHESAAEPDIFNIFASEQR